MVAVELQYGSKLALRSTELRFKSLKVLCGTHGKPGYINDGTSRARVFVMQELALLLCSRKNQRYEPHGRFLIPFTIQSDC